MGQGWDAGCLSKQCPNLPPGHCGVAVQACCLGRVRTYFPPRWDRDAGCLGGARTYLPGTVGQGCRLFKQCGNLPPAHCETGM